ncbi:hypothetical protein LSPH24S_05385 [Lysinibacillus sphaericus]
MKRKKIFILHEIYGVNDFIKDQGQTYSDSNTNVECISLYSNGKVFSYSQERETCLDISRKKSALIAHLND